MEWTREWNGRGNGMDKVMEWIITIPCLVWLSCGNETKHYFVLLDRQEKTNEQNQWLVAVVGGGQWR